MSESCVHVYAPQPSISEIRQSRCPTCDRWTWFVHFFTEWYGWASTCLRCGENWEDGERLERPFMRGWRRKSVEDSIRLFARRTRIQ